MKLPVVFFGLIMTLLASSFGLATTLKLSADIDLQVLDGRKISGSLLKGAEGLELEQGEHQLLFHVEKTLLRDAQVPMLWVSTPQIVTFTASTQSVKIQLPAMGTLREGKYFDRNPRVTLVDERGAKVDSKRDTLHTESKDNVEQAMVHYNLARNAASVPRFARQLQAGQKSTSVMPEASTSRHPAERMLRLWFLQVDSATRQRFVMLMNALHTG